jgi:nickel-type superoxide dismutase maturation protease
MLIGLGLLAASSALAAAVLSRIEVEGPSMEPTLSPGDRLLVVRRGVGRRLRVGDLVAVADPRGPGPAGRRLLVKRVTAVEGAVVTVRGDNEASSTDSRQFGPVPADAVAGRILYRYAPAGRTGRLRPHAAPASSTGTGHR